jgi:hypothetical protein
MSPLQHTHMQHVHHFTSRRHRGVFGVLGLYAMTFGFLIFNEDLGYRRGEHSENVSPPSQSTAKGVGHF